MPLVIKAETTINPQGTEVYIEFLNATGVYDAEDNPGGFGTPNPARNTLAAVLFAEHKRVDSDVPATISAYNALTVESFTVAMSKAVNGVLSVNIFLLPIFDDEEDYEDDDIVFDNTNPSIPIIKKMVDSEWVPVTAESLIGNTDISQLNGHELPIPDAFTLLNQLNRTKMKKLRAFVYGNCGKDDYQPLRDRYEYVEGLIVNATAAFCDQAFNEAQINVEEIFNYESQVINNGQ